MVGGGVACRGEIGQHSLPLQHGAVVVFLNEAKVAVVGVGVLHLGLLAGIAQSDCDTRAARVAVGSGISNPVVRERAQQS